MSATSTTPNYPDSATALAIVTAMDALIGKQSAALEADQSEIDDESKQIADLQSQLAAALAEIAALKNPPPPIAPTPPPIVPPVVLDPIASFAPTTKFLALEKTSFTLAGGTAANSGQTGSGGTAKTSLDAADRLIVEIDPAGAYYDCYEMHRVEGSNTPLPFPKGTQFRVRYGARYELADAATMSKCQAVEMDNSIYDGTHRYHGTGQLERASGVYRYYDPQHTKNADGTYSGAWVATKVAAPLVAGQPTKMTVLCDHDFVKHTTTYIGVSINGKYFPLSITVNNTAKAVAAPWIEATVQLDSDKNGDSYTCAIDQVDLEW